MPTAGEANIRPTNHYNLRNKPLPKTKPVVKKKKAGEKENIPEKPAPTGPITRSRSKIPVSTNHSSKTNKGREQKPKRKGVPDFAKLHKQWQDKFEKGKAVNKKTCTQVQEFDLTRPGTQFKQTYYDGQTEDIAGDFREDPEALESILKEEGISENATRGYRNTIATTGANHAASASTRKTLGSIPVSKSYRPNNADNLAHSTTKEKNKQPNDALKKPRKSLAQQQQEMGIEFEEDLGALASILNNTGLSHTRAVPTYRQTFASSRGAGGARASLFGGQPQTQKRTSIYYQPQASTKDAYEDYTRLVMRRLTTGDNGKPILPNRSSVHQPSTSVRTSIYRAALPTGVQQQQSTKARPMPTSTMKGTPGRVHVSQPSKPTGSTKKTPMTASRVPNPHFHSVLQKQEITSSPLLSGSRQIPESHLRTPATQKKVQWADDTIGIPSAKELAQSLFTDQTEPTAKVENSIVQQMEKYKEIEKLEKQLELEIQMLSDLGDLGESKISGKGASLDVHHREDLEGRTGADRDQQHPPIQGPVSPPWHPLSSDMVTSTEGFTTCVNPLQNHGTGEVQSRTPLSSGTAWSQPGENVHQYQLPAAGGMSSSKNDRYTGTPSHHNPIHGYSQTSVGLKRSQDSCAVGKPWTVPDHPLQQDMLASTRHDHINTQCTNLVGCNLVASQNNIPQGGLGVTFNRHHQLGQSVPSSQLGLNGCVAGVCSGHLIHSGQNASSQQMCCQCNMNKPSELQENLMLAKPIVTIYGDKLGTIPVHSVEHAATSAVIQPGLHQTLTQTCASDVHSSHCEKLHIVESDQHVNIPLQWAVRRNGEICNPAVNNSNSSQLCLHGNMLDAHHYTHLSGAPLPQKHGCTSTTCIHHHQLPTAKMSTTDGCPISKSDRIETTHSLIHSHPPSFEPNGVICSPAAAFAPSLKVSKVSKTVTFASPPAMESRERRLCSFRTTPHPGMPQTGVIQQECMDGVKGRLEFGTDCLKSGQNFSTNAAVSNAVVTSSVDTTTLSVIKTDHLEPVASTQVKGREPSSLQSEVGNSSASIQCKGQTTERISETAAGGNVETLSLRGHLQHHQNNRQTVTAFKGRAGVIFQEALLDQECTLYAHSLQRKLSTGSPSGRVDLDPIAKIFLEKDNAHFCPLLEQSFD